jgi:putative ABC transport system permease protein
MRRLRRGMSREEARRAAMLAFGGVESAKESYRDQRGFPLVANLWLDLRLAFRMLRRAPSVSVPAIAVLALGIGTATALYAVVYAMWLRPLAYPDSGRLVSVTTYFAGFKIDALASPDYGTWQGTRSLGPLGAYSWGSAAVIAPGETVEANRASISGTLPAILRIPAALGRPIEPADDSPRSAKVVMLSDGFWRERFGGNAGEIGRTVEMDGAAYTVIGVLPPGFRMPDGRTADLLAPLALGENWLRHGSGMKILYGVARLQPGATMDQARAELSTRLAASRAEAPKLYGDDVSLRVIPLQAFAVRESRTAAMVLAGAVAMILLIAGANVAGLLVARAAGRGREMAVRIALGASAGRIAQHLLMEGLVIGAAGVAGGLLVANGLLALVPWFASAMPVPAWEIAINGDVLAAALCGGLACALAFSLAPALPMPRLRLRRALVAGELALSLVLLAAAALLLENLVRLRSAAPGFRVERLVTARLWLNGTKFANTPTEFRRELRERLERTPGVLSVAFADALPPVENARSSPFSRADRPLPDEFSRTDNVIVRQVDAPFFETMGIPLVRGRLFTAADQSVAIVNRTLADRYFAGENPIGKQVEGVGVPWKTVIGVAGDSRNDGLQNPAQPEIYVPLAAGNARGGGITHNEGPNVVIRTAGDSAAMIPVLRGQLRAMDRSLLARVRMMDEQWAELQARPRFHATVFGAFAALALLMASAGVYGVLSHVVVLRRKEIGIRMALGARPVDVEALIVREALWLAGVGAAVGIAGSVAGARLLASVLDGVNPRDPVTLAATAGVLVILAIGASVVPARRAAHEDPAATLRAE